VALFQPGQAATNTFFGVGIEIRNLASYRQISDEFSSQNNLIWFCFVSKAKPEQVL